MIARFSPDGHRIDVVTGDELHRGLAYDIALLAAGAGINEAAPIVKDAIVSRLPRAEPEPEPPKVILPPGANADE